MAAELRLPKAYTRNYNVHPETIEFVTRLDDSRKQGRHSSNGEDSLDNMRKYWDSVVRELNEEIPFNGHIWDDVIPVDGTSEGIPVTIYKPENSPENPSILVYFHGGGFAIGSRKNTEDACKCISSESSCICMNVEYRLSPKYKALVIYSDARCIMRYVMSNKSKFGGTELSTVGIGGDSAGGTIASQTTHDVSGIDYQVVNPHWNERVALVQGVSACGDLCVVKILVYGSFDRSLSFSSCEEFKDDAIIPKGTTEFFIKLQWDGAIDLKAPIISALFRPSFTSLPPALFIVAQLDPLRDSSILYEEKLRAAGVKTELHLFEGVTHSFFVNPGVFKENCKRAYKNVAEFIRTFQ